MGEALHGIVIVLSTAVGHEDHSKVFDLPLVYELVDLIYHWKEGSPSLNLVLLYDIFETLKVICLIKLASLVEK
jgi:hypothetical protein